jgi:signal peptidase II
LRRKYFISGLVCLAALTLDQITKTMIRALYYSTMDERLFSFIPGRFELRYAENTGMAFGMLQNLDHGLRVPLFGVITLIAVIIIVHLLRQAPHNALRLPAALGFILAGAFGNLVDRLRWGGVVVDFIRVQLTSNYVWPTFNLADTFISIGIGLLVLDTIFATEPETDQTLPETAAAPGPETPPAVGPGPSPPPAADPPAPA